MIIFIELFQMQNLICIIFYLWINNYQNLNEKKERKKNCALFGICLFITEKHVIECILFRKAIGFQRRKKKNKQKNQFLCT